MPRKHSASPSPTKAKIESYAFPAGRTIIGVELLGHEARRSYGWRDAPVVLRLSDGKRLFASRDEEGNRPGTISVCGDGLGDAIYPPTIDRKLDDSLEFQQHYTGEARLVGKTIVKAQSLKLRGWSGRVIVLTLDNGTKIVPMSDPEGNAPGAWFGLDNDGDFMLPNQ